MDKELKALQDRVKTMPQGEQRDKILKEIEQKKQNKDVLK